VEEGPHVDSGGGKEKIKWGKRETRSGRGDDGTVLFVGEEAVLKKKREQGMQSYTVPREPHWAAMLRKEGRAARGKRKGP